MKCLELKIRWEDISTLYKYVYTYIQFHLYVFETGSYCNVIMLREKRLKSFLVAEELAFSDDADLAFMNVAKLRNALCGQCLGR